MKMQVQMKNTIRLITIWFCFRKVKYILLHCKKYVSKLTQVESILTQFSC